MKKILPIALIALVFAINIIIGVNFKEYNGFDYIFESAGNLCKTGLTVTIYTILFGALLLGIYTYLQRHHCVMKKQLSQWKVIGISYIFLLICYMPYLYIYFPGSINIDSVHQLAMYFGYREMTNHHPYFATVLMGTFVKIGMKLGNSAIGLFLYVLMQMFALAFAFAYSLGMMIKWKLSEKVVVGCFLFYGLMPFWGGYIQLMIKDTLYTVMIVLFVTIYLDCLIEHRTVAKTKIYTFVVIGVIAALLRNNGIYIVVPSILGGMIYGWNDGNRRVWFKGFVLSIGVWFIWGNIVLPLNGVKEGSIREMLSIPFQQTARYVQEYADEVTEEERMAIDTVLDYEQIKANYCSYGSDYVKNTYKEPENEKKALFSYFKHWLLMFFKHPVTYFEATIANSYYYYCANIVGSIEPIYVDTMHSDNYTDQMGLNALQKHPVARQLLSKALGKLQKIPIVRLLFSEGFYTYLLLGMCGFLIFIDKKRYIIGLLPSMISVLICVASPVLGSVRYFLPVMGCTCILLAYCLRCKQES